MEYKVIDYIKDGVSDSSAIENCISDAMNSDERIIIFDGRDYRIDKAITLPDNTTVIVDGCAIRQSDEVFDNIFRGMNHIIDPKEPYGIPLDVTPIKNVKILGKNNAKVVGTAKPRKAFHTVLKEYQLMLGDFWGWRTHMFSFSNGDNIEISGLRLYQAMGWTISFDCCSNVYVHDMEFHSTVKNGDGIDFRSGCHDCKVENITGYTLDDTVACSALASGKRGSYPSKNYLYPSQPYGSMGKEYNRDIHNIEIRNIMTGGFNHGVICLAARGNKIYNVTIENVNEVDAGKRESTVKIYTGYGSGYNAGDIHDISVKNVTAENAKYAVQIAAEVENVTLENIVHNGAGGETFFGTEQDGVTLK